MTIQDVVLKNHRLANQYKDIFVNTFSVSLLKFWSPLYGFDVVKFDKWLGTPDGTSTRDHIISRYGIEAAKMVKAMIHFESDLRPSDPAER